MSSAFIAYSPCTQYHSAKFRDNWIIGSPVPYYFPALHLAFPVFTCKECSCAVKVVFHQLAAYLLPRWIPSWNRLSNSRFMVVVGVFIHSLALQSWPQPARPRRHQRPSYIPHGSFMFPYYQHMLASVTRMIKLKNATLTWWRTIHICVSL